MTDLTDFLSGEVDRLRQQGLFRTRRRVTPLAGGYCQAAGQRLLNFATNDYLDLAHDRRLAEAARHALDEAGVGARSSALVCGRTDWHARLEERLARFEGRPAAVLFPSGYAANLGTIPALVGRDDALFSDRLNHASVVDGCRLSRAERHIYDRSRLDELESGLKAAGSRPRRWIVTDTLFSMDGDVAPLPELCELARQYGADLIVDEAHATGVLGASGRGAAEWMGVEDRIAVRIGTLSKSIGCLGGFVAGDERLVDWLWNRARTQIYSTALPPAVCAAVCAAVDIIECEPERRARLLALADHARVAARERGLVLPENGVGPIIPVVLCDPFKAVAVAEQLQQQGFLVAAIRPPTVPDGTSRLRISLTCAHREEDVDRMLQAIGTLVHSTRQP